MLAGAINREMFQGRLLFLKWALDSALCSFYSHGLQEKRNIEGLFASIPVVILVEFIFSAPFLNATLTVRSCSR